MNINPLNHTIMKKITIVRSGHPPYNKIKADGKSIMILYNYVVTGGDVDQYIKDMKAMNRLAVEYDLPQTIPAHIGLPRFITNVDLGDVAEVTRYENSHPNKICNELYPIEWKKEG